MGFRSIRRSDIYVTLHTFSWEFACFFWGGIFKGFRLILVEMSRLATTSRYVNLQKSEGRVQNQEVELFAEVERLQCVRHALFTCFLLTPRVGSIPQKLKLLMERSGKHGF